MYSRGESSDNHVVSPCASKMSGYPYVIMADRSERYVCAVTCSRWAIKTGRFCNLCMLWVMTERRSIY